MCRKYAARTPVAHWSRAAERVTVESADLGPWAGLLAGEPRWQFGDGGSAAGDSVAHAYARAGRYTVSVFAADSAGGVSTVTATVTVIGGETDPSSRRDPQPLPPRVARPRLAHRMSGRGDERLRSSLATSASLVVAR